MKVMTHLFVLILCIFRLFLYFSLRKWRKYKNVFFPRATPPAPATTLHYAAAADHYDYDNLSLQEDPSLQRHITHRNKSVVLLFESFVTGEFVRLRESRDELLLQTERMELYFVFSMLAHISCGAFASIHEHKDTARYW